MSIATSVISDKDLKAAADALCKIRGVEATPENLASAASQIQTWQEIQAAIDSTTPVNVG